MPIDTSMYGQLKPVQIDSPVNALAQALQVQHLQAQNALMPIQMQQLQLANAQKQQQFDMIKPILTRMAQRAQGGGSNALTQDDGSATAGNALVPNRGGDLPYDLNDLAGMALAGVPGAKEALDIYKYQTDGVKRDPGAFYKNPTTGKMEYVPDVKSGLDYNPDTKTVSTLNGAPQALASITGANKGAEIQATNDNSPPDTTLQMAGPDGRLIVVPGATKGEQLARMRGQSPQASQAPAPSGPQGLDLSKLAPQQVAWLAKQDPEAFANGVQDFQQTSGQAANPQQQGGYTPPSTTFDGKPVPPQAQAVLVNLAQSRDPAKLQQFVDSATQHAYQSSTGPQLQAQLKSIQTEAENIRQSWQQAPTSAPASGAPSAGISLASPSDIEVEKNQRLADVKLKNEPRLAYATDTNKNMADYEKSLNERVTSGNDLMMRIAESRKALANFNTGGGMDNKIALAKTAQSFGVPQSIVDRIAGGDLSAAQEFQKLAAQQAMESLKQSIGGSRIAQAEFKVFQANNPNIDTDPRAVEKVYNFATKVFQRDKAEQDAFASYKQIPGADITAFPNWWATQQQKLGYVTPEQTPVASNPPPGPTPASPKPAPAPVNIPSEAVKFLKANPNLRAQFDAKYGAGASASILGK